MYRTSLEGEIMMTYKEALLDLHSRLDKAELELKTIILAHLKDSEEYKRLKGKIEGVQLAKGYMRDYTSSTE